MTVSKIKARFLRFLWGLIPWLMVALVAATIVVLGGWIKNEQVRLAEARKEAVKKDVPAVRVITLTLEPHRLEDKISLPAEVEPFEELWVKAEVQGQVIRVDMQEGQLARPGDLLVLLDERDYRSRLARIEANHTLAKADHDRIAALVKTEHRRREQTGRNRGPPQGPGGPAPGSPPGPGSHPHHGAHPRPDQRDQGQEGGLPGR